MRLAKTKKPNPAHREDGVVYVTIHSKGEVYTFLVDEDDYWTHVAPYRWNLVSGYVATNAWKPNGEKTTTQLHRRLHDPGPGLEVDHISRDRLDNRRGNLRTTTRKQNCENMPLNGGTSKYRGVSWRKGDKKWKASVQHHGKQHTKQFKSELEAHAWAVRKRAELFTHHEEQ